MARTGVLNPFVRLLERRVGRASGRPALRFRREDGFVTWTWNALWRETLVTAAGLRAAGISPGGHVLLLLPDVEDAVRCLFGVWAAGAVPIQIGLPFRRGDESLAPFLDEIAQRQDAAAIVLSSSLADLAQGTATRLIQAEDLSRGGALTAPVAAPGPALIQLTSGSAGRPRGVVIPAERLIRHLDAITQALPSGARAVGVSWLPLHHDMGLIGGLLYPLYNDFPLHLFSPWDFRSRPYGWLATMSEVGATHTAAPPSAFALATRFARRAIAEGLDLGRLRCAMVGAEPIPPAVLRDFSRGFAACGFRPEAFFPVYGLAEATVAVTFPAPLSTTRVDRIDRSTLQQHGRAVPSGADDALGFTGVGGPIPGTQIRIANPAGEAVAERVVGEIQLRTDSGMTGYYRDPEATRSAFHAGWLRTGDLGYMAGGTLYVTGRRKELIIRGGQNLVPQVVEEAAHAVGGVRQGGVAVVGIRSAVRGTERAVLVAETALRRELHQELVSNIATTLKARALEVDEIRLVAPHVLPRTTSGKLRRRALATMLTASDPSATEPFAQ